MKAAKKNSEGLKNWLAIIKAGDARLLFFPTLCLTAYMAFFFFSAYDASADEQFRPYLHKAVVPEHPKLNLYGTYTTELFPGAASYTYQFDIPPGTNGLQPALAISYNSQSVKQRPGILGAGWALTQSYIFRNANSTLNDTSDDYFKLILNGAAHDLIYNSSDGFYRTKIEAYMRIQNFPLLPTITALTGLSQPKTGRFTGLT